MYRSEHILKGLSNQYYRATYKSMGFTTEDLKRPIIGIANAWSECVPGHYNLRQVAQRVKDGIYRAGGTPIEFGVIGGCDGMGQGHDGMHFIMPSRELIANSIESMAQINLFDGLVLLGSCDKIVPGMLKTASAQSRSQVGLAYGLLMQQAGYNFLWSGACSLFVLAGSLQFLMVTFFAGGVSLATVAVLALLLNSRHIFYGLSFIDKFRSFGPWRWFLIYSLCDENYSLHCSHDFGPDVNEKWAYVLTAALVTFYWVTLSMLGGLVRGSGRTDH